MEEREEERAEEEEEEEELEDAATQLVIEQSLRARCKLPETEETALGRNSAESVRIFTAIRRGDEETLRQLCAGQTDRFLETDSRGWTPLHEAAAQSNITLLELTHTASGGGSVLCSTLSGQTPLHLALERGILENCCFLLEHGADPDQPDQNLDFPLLLAVRSQRGDLTSLLLRHGSRVTQGGAHGRTALHEASLLGGEEPLRLLLEAGAPPDPPSHYGLTPLGLAAQGGHLEAVRTLLDRGVSVASRAQDGASILFEACTSGAPPLIRLLLEAGADANVAKHTGHLPIHRAAHLGHLGVVQLLLPHTSMQSVQESGMSPIHSAAAGAHPPCIQALLDAGYDPNFMLHPCVRRNYDDERRSALFFAVSNDDVASVRLLLEAGAMSNQDPVKCLQVALRLGNYELINLLLRFGANVNYFSKINTTHFPSALQYALKDEVVLRMLCNYGYDVERCFDCSYGNGSHVPEDYEGWTNTVIKDTMFCEVITVFWLKDLSGHVVRVMLDYVDHVTFCSKLRAVLKDQNQWLDICRLQENVRPLQHLCRLRIRRCLGRLRLRAPVFMSFLPLPQRLKDYVLYREYNLYSPAH